MQKYLKLADYNILVNYYEGFREKATITIPTNENQVIPFWDIVSLFETNDISELKFYYDANEDLPRSKRKSELDLKFDGSLKGYTKILTTVDSRDAKLGTITLLKPNVNNMDLDEVKEVMNEQMQQSQMMYAVRAMTVTLTDEQALHCIDLFDEWKTNTKYIVGDRKKYQSKLYKCINEHTSQDSWSPDKTPSLWTVINEENKGTIDDPIPYSVNMIVYKDKYYIEDGILYICTRDSEIALHNKASELIGHYFEVVES